LILLYILNAVQSDTETTHGIEEEVIEEGIEEAPSQGKA
jgi:hypothetical protein